jgi:hypothetical protein
MVASWNQIMEWLEEMGKLQRARTQNPIEAPNPF